MRCVLALALLRAVSGEWHDVAFIGKGKSKGKDTDKGKGKGKAIAGLPMEELPEARAKGKGKGALFPGELDEVHEAHVCHKNCANDGRCHDKCPKPWDKLVEACHQLPQLKKCYAKCSGHEECLKTCITLDLNWIQKIFGQGPDMVDSGGERTCLEFEKRHACHQACTAGDLECHTRCHHVGRHWQRNHGNKEGQSEHQWQHNANYASHYHGEHNWPKRKTGRPRHVEHDMHYSRQGDRNDDRSQEFQHKWKPEQKGSFLDTAMKILTISYDKFMQMTSNFRSYHQSNARGEVVI